MHDFPSCQPEPRLKPAVLNMGTTILTSPKQRKVNGCPSASFMVDRQSLPSLPIGALVMRAHEWNSHVRTVVDLSTRNQCCHVETVSARRHTTMAIAALVQMNKAFSSFNCRGSNIDSLAAMITAKTQGRDIPVFCLSELQ